MFVWKDYSSKNFFKSSTINKKVPTRANSQDNQKPHVKFSLKHFLLQRLKENKASTALCGSNPDLRTKKKKRMELKLQSTGLLLLLLLFWISTHITVPLRTPSGVQVCKFTLEHYQCCRDGRVQRKREGWGERDLERHHYD